jgi:RNA polymerase sigma-70 factor (sigma-E family)
VACEVRTVPGTRQSSTGEVFRLDPEVREILEEYVRARGPRLVRTAYLLTGDQHVAEDIVQNALASMVVSWRRIQDLSNLDAYVYRSLVNARRRWWRRRWTGEIPVGELPDEPSGDDVGRVDRYTDLLAVLRTLPPRQRAVIVLRYFEDLSEAQTASILDCSIGSVKSQASRGLVAMRAVLQNEADASSRPADEGASR